MSMSMEINKNDEVLEKNCKDSKRTTEEFIDKEEETEEEETEEEDTIDVRQEHYDWVIQTYLKYITAGDNWWKQDDGVLKYIGDMGLDHMNNCIKKIDNDIKRYTGDLPNDILLSMKKKKSELKSEIKKRIR